MIALIRSYITLAEANIFILSQSSKKSIYSISH